MQPGTPIDFAQRYEDLAAAVARDYGKVSQDWILSFVAGYRGVYPETIDDIQANPHEFCACVKLYAMAIANPYPAD